MVVVLFSVMSKHYRCLLLPYHVQTKCENQEGNGTKKTEGFVVPDKFNEVKCRTFPLLACYFRTPYKSCIIYFNVFKSVRHICATLKASEKF